MSVFGMVCFAVVLFVTFTCFDQLKYFRLLLSVYRYIQRYISCRPVVFTFHLPVLQL